MRKECIKTEVNKFEGQCLAVGRHQETIRALSHLHGAAEKCGSSRKVRDPAVKIPAEFAPNRSIHPSKMPLC